MKEQADRINDKETKWRTRDDGVKETFLKILGWWFDVGIEEGTARVEFVSAAGTPEDDNGEEDYEEEQLPEGFVKPNIAPCLKRRR